MSIAVIARRLRVAGWPITCPACQATYRADFERSEASGQLVCSHCSHIQEVGHDFVDALAAQLLDLSPDDLDDAFRRGI